MTDLKELVKQTQVTKHMGWWDKIEDPLCLQYMAWVACDHMEGKKANYAALHRILRRTFNVSIGQSSVTAWMAKVESGELTYERPNQETSTADQ